MSFCTFCQQLDVTCKSFPCRQTHKVPSRSGVFIKSQVTVNRQRLRAEQEIISKCLLPSLNCTSTPMSLRQRSSLTGQTVRLFLPYITRKRRDNFTNVDQVTDIDLSKYGTPEGNLELSQALIKAVRTKGFFYVTNFGISQAAVDKQFALGQAFYDLPLEEKLNYVPNLDAGEYNGYRPAGRRPLAGGVLEKTEVWNMASKLHRILSGHLMLVSKYLWPQ